MNASNFTFICLSSILTLPLCLTLLSICFSQFFVYCYCDSWQFDHRATKNVSKNTRFCIVIHVFFIEKAFAFAHSIETDFSLQCIVDVSNEHTDMGMGELNKSVSISFRTKRYPRWYKINIYIVLSIDRRQSDWWVQSCNRNEFNVTTETNPRS